MAACNEPVVSTLDAEVLASVVGDRHLASRFEKETGALAELLSHARMVPHEELPCDRVAMNCRVTYLEGGAKRTVTIVHPAAADAAKLRVSVLSPVARALLGRQPGNVVKATAPGGGAMTLRILEIARP